MAIFRQIHTHIWKREWFLDLDPQEKLLFIYLFSNELAAIAGIYQIPLRVIAFETGLETGFIKRTLDKLQKMGKVMYGNGVLWVINLRKYNETKSPKLVACINGLVDAIPECEVKRKYLAYYSGRSNDDTVSVDDNTVSIGFSEFGEETETETEAPPPGDFPAHIGDLVAYYENNSGLMVAERAKADLLEVLDKRVSWDTLRYAEQIATERGMTVANQQRWKYLLGIIRREINGTGRGNGNGQTARASPGTNPSNIVVWS